ncbi:MAG: DNA mismatch repair protein MutS [Proteobacteria bacterium]|nr:MAG: DNA mismatch repair protein MutS [Pseudomonadota bacterium]
MAQSHDPAQEYERRRAARQQRVDALERRFSQLANVRLLLFVVAIGLAVASWGFDALSPLSLFAPGLLFAIVVVAHEVVVRRREQARRAVAFYDAALARLAQRWQGIGPDGLALVAEEHVFAADLDLVGEGSLFQLLSQARTRAGERALARWLLEPRRVEPGEDEALVARLRSRNEAVAELCDALDLREALALAGEDVRAELEPERLCAWGEAPAALPQSPALWIALWLPALATPTALGLALGGLLPWLPFWLLLALEGVIYRLLGKQVNTLIAEVDAPGQQLSVLAEVLALLEGHEARAEASPRLRELGRRLSAGGLRASKSVASLQRRLAWLESMKNPMFAPLGMLLLWPLHLGAAVERWRRVAGGEIRVWLATLGELEALHSLASFAYDHPSAPFAELVEGGEEGSASLEGEALTHPLMAPGHCVANDVRLDAKEGAVSTWIISGSNMSGKSTYLRTVGINVALALAGAPVSARRLRLTPLSLGATLRIQDSLHDGRSRFFAEVRRLKQLSDLADDPEAPPLLFLLDELLHGTNSADRQAGARALLARYAERGALGLVTTHDLALGQEADGAGWLGNKHFVDAVTAAGAAAVEGKGALLSEEEALRFDYTLRDGRLEGSNALALMRAVGLDV